MYDYITAANIICCRFFVTFLIKTRIRTITKTQNIMGGMTKLRLKDCSINNIRKQNEQLKNYNVPKYYRFYSDDFIKLEYDAFIKNEGVFSERLFPKDRINSFEDFKKYWSPEALGEIFVPKTGTLKFDCYFGRTSKTAIHNIARYVLNNMEQIKCVEGSYSTFVERSAYCIKTQKKLLELE